MLRVRLARVTVMAALLGAGRWSQAQVPDQYPKPLTHTPTGHPAMRVLLLTIEGMHAIDLARWVTSHPYSALAELSRRGVRYTNAHTTAPFPVAGLVSLATGGTPISTGLVSDDGYDRLLSPADSPCNRTGAAIGLTGQMNAANGVGLDSSKFPRDVKRGCAPVPPHGLVRVNTMFEVVNTKIGPTAWIGGSASATDVLRGPSGRGIDDSCGVDGASTPGGEIRAAHQSDGARVAAVLHWIDGLDCTGKLTVAVPALFGMSFGAVATAQAAPGMGYVDGMGTPSAGLDKALKATDESIGRIVMELKARHLYETTWIAVTSPYGQAPMDARRVKHIPLEEVRATAWRAGAVAHVSGGDVAMLWLTDATKTDAVVQALSERAMELGIVEIYSGARLRLTLNLPADDSRMPDIVLQPELGVLWGLSQDKAIAGHGGMSDEDTHVALLVSGAQLTGRTDPTWVPTTQLAPLLLRALGMEKFDLEALHLEHSPALPGIF